MQGILENALSAPLTMKAVLTIIGIVTILILARLVQRSLTHRIKHTETRYRVRKLITFAAYLVGILFIASVFSEQLGGLTVAFGVASAGVAFALQQVIVSIAGWVAISFGHYYQIGDRVQMGGIMGDVIDIAVLRTTLMECGAWAGEDQYNGRIVRIGNNVVFTDPVFNYSAHFPFLWDEITLPIKYGSDYHLARDILQRVVTDVVGEHVPHARVAWEHMVERYMIDDQSVEPFGYADCQR